MAITLSQGIPEWFYDQFTSTLYHVCQQKESLLGSAVRIEPISAEDKAFDLMDEFSIEEKVGRNPQTPSQSPSTQRRWVSTTPYHGSTQKDSDDDLQMLLDPMGDYATAFRRAVNRQKDTIILAAFEATVQAGRRTGDSTVTWAGSNGNVKYSINSSGESAGRTIPHDCSEGNCDATQTGMTVEKAELIMEYMRVNEVDADLPIFCVISPRQATNLFGQAEYVSSDYNTSKPLATGRIIPNWHGINWIVSNMITVGSSNDVDADTNVYECWAWAQDGIILGVADELSVQMSVRDDLSYAQQIYVHMNMGAIRADEDKILKVECQ